MKDKLRPPRAGLSPAPNGRVLVVVVKIIDFVYKLIKSNEVKLGLFVLLLRWQLVECCATCIEGT